MNPEPQTEEEKQQFMEQVGKKQPIVNARTQVYLHMHADTLLEPEPTDYDPEHKNPATGVSYCLACGSHERD